jgi:hypothetical protein
MISTVNSVRLYTGYDVTLDLILRAQALIEVYIGRNEIDIEAPSDLLILDKMVSYQTAYMLENEDIVFKQAALTSQGQTDAMVNFDIRMMSPFMSPLAIIAANGLSWNRSRSYRTGKIFQRGRMLDWRRY